MRSRFAGRRADRVGSPTSFEVNVEVRIHRATLLEDEPQRVAPAHLERVLQAQEPNEGYWLLCPTAYFRYKFTSRSCEIERLHFIGVVEALLEGWR